MTTKTGAVEVTTTVVIDGVTQTFTAAAHTGGDPSRAARGILAAVQDDAAKWTFDVAKESR